MFTCTSTVLQSTLKINQKNKLLSEEEQTRWKWITILHLTETCLFYKVLYRACHEKINGNGLLFLSIKPCSCRRWHNISQHISKNTAGADLYTKKNFPTNFISGRWFLFIWLFFFLRDILLFVLKRFSFHIIFAKIIKVQTVWWLLWLYLNYGSDCIFS